MTSEPDTRIRYIYRITNKVNGKIYIGQTVEPNKRWYQHRRDAAHPTMIIHHAIKKYGADAFIFEVIASCKTWEDANEVETLLVSQYDSLVPNGYNVSFGGMNAPKSEAWKLSVSGKNHWLNRPENKDKVTAFKELNSSIHSGKITAEETKLLISNTLKSKGIEPKTCRVKGKTPWNKGGKGLQVSHQKGKKLTDEVKKKKSEAMKGKTWALINGKRVWSPKQS